MGQKLGWALWIVGTAIVLASWVEFVTPDIGWVGFGVAVLGVLMSSATRREKWERERDRANNEESDDGQRD